MSTLLDRIATAIFVSADDAHNTWPGPWHPECQKMAKAVIAAAFTFQPIESAPRDREDFVVVFEDGQVREAKLHDNGDWFCQYGFDGHTDQRNNAPFGKYPFRVVGWAPKPEMLG